MRSPHRGTPPTLALVLEQNTEVRANCQLRACMHSAVLDVAALAERLGGETTVPAMRDRLRCQKCGGRDVALTLSPRHTGGIGG